MPIITSPVRPTQKDTKTNQSRKNVSQEKILNQITDKYNSNKSELGLEKYKAHAASPSIKIDPKRGKYERHETYQPKGELIYGIYPVQLALEAQRRTFHHLMYKKGCELRNEKIRDMVDTAASRGIRTTGLTLSQFRKVLTGDQTHQGICCDVSHLPFLDFQEHEYLTVKQSRERRKNGMSEGNQYNSSEGSVDEESNLHIDQDSLASKAKDKHMYKNLNISSASSLDRTSSCYQDVFTNNRTDINCFQSNQEDPVHKSSESEIPQLWIYLDQIQDPMNFGAVLRSAYFFGVDKILTSECNRLVTLYR